MRIVHICTSLDGGAGICAQRIANATKEQGVEVRFLISHGHKSEGVAILDETSYMSHLPALRLFQRLARKLGVWPKAVRVSKAICKERKNYRNSFATSPVTTFEHLVEHPFIQEADIVHLHWVGNFVDYQSFFQKCKKPIVWTIHDEGPGLGCFHYTMWKKNAPESFQRLDNQLMEIKRKAYEKVHYMMLVAISEKMSDYFSKNPLLSQFPKIIIHNGIDGESFTPINKNLAREALGIKQDDLVFMFSAYNIHEDRKGLKELIAVLDNLDKPNCTLICLGNYSSLPSHKTTLNLRLEGFISNKRLQSLYYSASDFFCMPSFQEAFAQTPLEAMACGTPVVAFPCSGTKELINERNGVVCDDFTVEALSLGIKQAISNISNYNANYIRNDLLSRFSYNIIADQYIQLYRSVLSQSNNL